ncbi:MAG TPA: FAD-dependent oxidoreductase, partial [Candidatus Binatus sp.]|nr:FAD-dependent oxidoreductase [Candidatus Binatus sp.]
MEQYDIVIVGGGMAGLSAALYGGWLGRKVFLAEKQMFGGQVVNADQIENYPGFPDGVLGADLVSQARMQAMKFGAKMAYCEVTAIRKQTKGFVIETANEPCEAKTLIFAAGGKPRAVGIPGEIEFAGNGVSHCATCDGAFFVEKPVAVIGGGDSALDEALYLANICSKVSIVHQGDAPTASATLLERARQNSNIEFVANSHAVKIVGADAVEALELASGAKFEVAAVFIAVGCDPDTALLKDVVSLDPMG